jgi:hypothetical protein
MEKIGVRRVVSYFEPSSGPIGVTNNGIRRGAGHPVRTYFELAKKVAELQFRSREYVLLFRGQQADHLTQHGASTLKPSLFRLEGKKLPTKSILERRFETLRQAEAGLVASYSDQRFLGIERLRRHRILRWAILQHYDVCPTPLLDVTQSLRVAATFASLGNNTPEAFVFVLAVPNVSGAVTASAEAGLQVVRLSSACPPEAVRPHLQEGYLLGEYPEITDIDQNTKYSYYEMDFGRRLIAKFRLDLPRFWRSTNYPPATKEALYPKEHRDPLLGITDALRSRIGSV